MNINKIEKKSWKTMWIDGAPDICLGLILFISSLGMMYIDKKNLIINLYVLPVLVNIGIKRFITFPRIGRPRYGGDKKNIFKFALFITMVITLFILIVVYNIFGYISTSAIAISSLIFLIFAINAYIFDFNRMYFYAVWVTATFLFSELAISKTGQTSAGASVYMSSSIIVFSIGIFILANFIGVYKIDRQNNP